MIRPTWARQLSIRCGPGGLPNSTPQEGIWTLVKRGIGNLATADVDHLARTVPVTRSTISA